MEAVTATATAAESSGPTSVEPERTTLGSTMSSSHLDQPDPDSDGGLQSGEGEGNEGEASAATNSAANGNGTALATAKLSTKKKEALSQVPCKFFRSNGCSAGTACPFAHVMPGGGQNKAVCQWYLKGNCRFGHRCALAHILPGQPMSMDRKNKRAAQQQQQGVQNGHQPGQAVQNHNVLPGQIRHPIGNRSGMPAEGNRAAMPVSFGMPPHFAHGLPGPPLHVNGRENGDLMFGLPDDLSLAMEQHPPTMGQTQRLSNEADWHGHSNAHAFDGGLSTSLSRARVGSPATVPAFGTSPFSHPGSLSVFYSGAAADSERLLGRSQGQLDDDAMLRHAAERSWQSKDGAQDDNAEEFLPSSLSDLLTPAELERRQRSKLAGTTNLAPVLTTSSQSMPARDGLSSSLRWTSNEQTTDRSPGRSGVVTSGFLASRLTGELSRTRDGWADAAASDTNGQVHPSVHPLASGSGAAFSPAAQAVLSHAPGQSLPQGLAAGLSRLHLRSDTNSTVMGGPSAGLAVGAANGRARLVSDLDDQPIRSPHAFASASPGVIGGARSSIDDLGPVVPSSLFNSRGTPLYPFGRSIGAHSAAHSIEAGSSLSRHGHNGMGMMAGSPHYQNASPALRATEGGIAIPNGSVSASGKLDGAGAPLPTATATTTIGSIPLQQRPMATGHHPGLHRIRAAASGTGGIGASPLSLPTTGEEVEEAIFELE